MNPPPTESELLAKPRILPAMGGLPASVHVFERDSIRAFKLALACGRPLLVRGEPGAGKSQLARAIAVALERVFLSVFVHARTDAHDLLWSYDAVARLAKAQAWAAYRGEQANVDEQLAEVNFVRPGPLWWALNWAEAETQAQTCANASRTEVDLLPCEPPCKRENGVVLLIDEIDKADSSVPNGLLESLGQGTFAVPGRARVHADGPAPLVLLTTNAERTLPEAFLRRCVVLFMSLPEADPDKSSSKSGPSELVEWLVKRGDAHFKGLRDRKLLTIAAKQVEKDRYEVRGMPFCPPGLAEYIDLLNGVLADGEAGARGRIEQLAKFVLSKHVDRSRA